MNVIIYLLIAIVVIAIIVIIVRRLRPRGIAKEANKLRDLFLEKEDWERYLTGLGELEQQDDTRSKALHGSLRGGYQQRVAETIEEIAGVKSTLRRGLEDKQRIRQAYQIELERLAAKFKTGELPLQKYEASERKLRKKIELIEPDIKAIERLISAESSGEVKSYRGTATKKPFVPKTSARETRGAESLPEDEASVKRGGSSRLPKIMGIVGAIIVVAIITGLLLGREAPASIHPWPIYGHDAQWSFRSSYTGPEVPAVNWVIDLSDTTSQPLIGADGHIYFSEERDGILSIISLNLDGNTRSMMRVADESSYDDYGGLVFLAPGPTVAFYVLLDQQDGATVIALDAAYEELWRTHSEFFIYPPASKLGSDGTLYLAQVPDEDSRLARLEALRDDGTQKWTLALTDTASYVAIALHGTIYIYKEDGRVYAYDTDGRQSWRSNVLPGLPRNYAGCWLAIGPDDTLYVLAVPVDSSEYPMVCALTSSGHIKWHVDIQEVGVDLHFPAVGPDSEFYVHFGNKTLYMIDKEGQLVDFATIPGDFKSTILVDSANNVYACGSDYLYAFSSDGSLKWELPIAVDGSYLAMGSDGTIYVGGEDSEYEIKLYAISHALAK
jgi:outer membrane protein assembly factor BamB